MATGEKSNQQAWHSLPGAADFLWLSFLWGMWWFLLPLHQKLNLSPVGEEGLVPTPCWQDLPPSDRPGHALSWGGKVHQPNTWASTMEKLEERIFKCMSEWVYDHLHDTAAWKWGQQCSPAHPMPSSKNLLLPFQGDFGEDDISALPGTRAAVCLQNKALLFSNEPSSKSFCPQDQKGNERLHAGTVPSISTLQLLGTKYCPVFLNVLHDAIMVMETMTDALNTTVMSFWSAPSLPLSRGRAEPSPERRSLWGGGTQSCTVLDHLHGSAQGSSLHPCAFALTFTSPVYFM